MAQVFLYSRLKTKKWTCRIKSSTSLSEWKGVCSLAGSFKYSHFHIHAMCLNCLRNKTDFMLKIFWPHSIEKCKHCYMKQSSDYWQWVFLSHKSLYTSVLIMDPPGEWFKSGDGGWTLPPRGHTAVSGDSLAYHSPGRGMFCCWRLVGGGQAC